LEKVHCVCGIVLATIRVKREKFVLTEAK